MDLISMTLRGLCTLNCPNSIFFYYKDIFIMLILIDNDNDNDNEIDLFRHQ